MTKAYSKMTVDEAWDEYASVFGHFYAFNWDSTPDNWREDIIECLETGKPQDTNDPKYPWNKPMPGVKGVDYIE